MRNNWRFWTSVTCSALFLNACATKPVPGDYGLGLKTTEIVNHVRCEARAAIARVTMDRFNDPKNSEALKTLNNTARRLALEVPSKNPKLSIKSSESAGGEGSYSEFDALISHFFDSETSRFDKRLKSDPKVAQLLGIVEEFSTTAIGYQFTFTITENNNFSLLSVFSNNVSSGIFSAMPKGNIDRRRRNKRAFTIIEKIETLVFDERIVDPKNPNSLCNEHTNLSANRIYPISGKIGLLETFDTFAKLVLEEGLGRLDFIKSGTKKISSGAFVDTLTFTTTFGGSIDPTIVISPVGTLGSFARGSSTLVANRTDEHQLLLTLLYPQGRKNIDNAIQLVSQRLRDERLNGIFPGQ